MNPRRLNSLERYRWYVEQLNTLPQFTSFEDAEAELEIPSDGDAQFILRRGIGAYTLCTARFANGKWTKREDLSFSHGDIWKLRREAALALGMELLEDFENDE